ncbi:MAG: succinylglutamate desuccinylase/aspartoacylase family protein [Alphaproteobacteria bacterium]|nr:succinylglutamate desuccinylase/aspartoacylase family protein [Alphaproteobacteria bacterium]
MMTERRIEGRAAAMPRKPSGGNEAPRELLEHRLPAVGFGTERVLTAWRYGAAGARPKAYLQAAIHADEIPGMMVMHHLIPRLDALARAGSIKGEIVIVPVANPIGLAQNINGVHLGRFELSGAGNFNRKYPDLATPVGERVAGRLTGDAAGNVATIRTAMQEVLAEARPRNETDWLRVALLRLSVDADIVLDLHCDSEALMHLYTSDQSWPDAADLSAELGSRATLLAETSGGNPFDEACSTPWIALARRFGPGHPIPPACLAATVELRGDVDVSDALAEQDAAALIRFLQRRDILAGDPGALPAPRCEATRLDAVDVIRAEAAGILAYHRRLGDQIKEDDVVAEIVDPMGPRIPCTSRTDGLLLSRRGNRFVRPGDTIAKIVGTRTLPERLGGNLLSD